MSGVVPKRSQEEGVVTHPSSSSSPSSKHPHEDSGSSYPKSTHPPVSTPPPAQAHQTHQLHSIPHPPLAAPAPAPAYEVESRTVKGSRSEPRDGERRSPLQSVYRSPSLPLPASVSSSDPHLTHTSVLLESRDGTKDVRAESRDNRSEGREIQGPPKGERSGDDSSGKGNTGSYTRNEGRDDVYGEAKREIQGAKSDRDAKSDHHKAETKMEKDVQKDYHRGKRAEGSPQVGVKDSSGPVEGPHLEGRGETVGENKVEDRFKEKEKKRKDLKQREWGDGDKDRNDRRGSVLAGGSVTNETKVVGREEREASRWERERMEQNDRERNKEKEKDHIKREPQSNAEKEVSQNEKELSEASAKPAEQEYVAPEQEDREKDEKESKEKRRERDGDSEAERAEKRSRISEKESEDEGAAAAEREKDALSVQQRKRMLRPRGSPQTTNRDRVCSRSQDKEGVQGKPKVIVVVYKVGECVQELIKLWKEYESSQPDKSGDFATNGPTLEVRIPAEHVTATNRQVRGGQLWGTDIYTDDSDLIAVLMHTGYCRPTASPPPPEMQELRATIRVLPSQEYYTSKLRNNVRSRAWGAGIGCSYRVERCYILKKGGGTIELEPSLTHSSSVEPTLAPMAVERSMTTRAAASNALRQQRFVREVTIQYNLCNEPWIKYSIGIVADKGLKKPMFTSARLKKGEVLYLETHSCRYELCFAGEKSVKAFQASQQHSPQDAMEIDNSNNNSQNHLTHVSNGDKTDSENGIIDVFRWSRCKKPLPQKLMRSMGFPLPPDHVEVLEENLDWEDVEWSQTGVWIAGKEYSLARVHFLAPN